MLDDFGKAMHLNEALATLFDNIELVQEQFIQVLEDLCFVFELCIGNREGRIAWYTHSKTGTVLNKSHAVTALQAFAAAFVF